MSCPGNNSKEHHILFCEKRGVSTTTRKPKWEAISHLKSTVIEDKFKVAVAIVVSPPAAIENILVLTRLCT